MIMIKYAPNGYFQTQKYTTLYIHIYICLKYLSTFHFTGNKLYINNGTIGNKLEIQQNYL